MKFEKKKEPTSSESNKDSSNSESDYFSPEVGHLVKKVHEKEQKQKIFQGILQN